LWRSRTLNPQPSPAAAVASSALTLSDQTTVEVLLSRAAVFTARHNVYVVISQIGASSPIIDKLATESYGIPGVSSVLYNVPHWHWKRLS